MNEDNRGQSLATVTGKPGTISLGTLAPSMFGTTMLELFETRVVETTVRVVSSRDSEILLTEIDSAEMISKGNPVWLLVGLLTLGLFGLGIIFFLLYFFIKHRFLIVHSKSSAQIVGIKGDEKQFRDFMAATLALAEEQKIRLHK